MILEKSLSVPLLVIWSVGASNGAREGELELTGTVTIVSAMNNFFSQYKTKLPGKWPPVLMAVMLGRIFWLVPEGPSINWRVWGVGGF